MVGGQREKSRSREVEAEIGGGRMGVGSGEVEKDGGADG